MMEKELYQTIGYLIKKSEQLRILKNFVALEDVLCKSQIETLIKAMEEQTNE